MDIKFHLENVNGTDHLGELHIDDDTDDGGSKHL
jgi:hypothetical protein